MVSRLDIQTCHPGGNAARLSSGRSDRQSLSVNTLYLLLADLVLSLHVLTVAFVVAGLLVIIAGKLCGWAWVRNPWFRLTHFACILVVVMQAWAGVVCPLTTLEMWLRARAGDVVYSGSFITYWLSELLYFNLPAWVFTLAYTVFGGLVALTWFWVKPDAFGRGNGNPG